MNKLIASIVVLAGVAAANAQFPINGTLETFADSNINGDAPASATTLGAGRTWNVRSSGVVTGTSGIRFMTIQGSSAGSFAGWGLIEFDPSEALGQIQSQVAATPGATGFVITGATFRAQQQSSQPFSAVNGALQLLHVTDDATNAAALSGASYTTQLGAATAVDASFNYIQSPSANFDFNEAGSDYSSVLADWNSGTDPIRMILNPGSASVVAPFKGSSSPFQGINAPSFILNYQIVPEPASLALLALGAVAALRRR